jgi:hypothetical protein
VPERETMPMRPGLWMWPGMMPILHWPGVITPGQFGPISTASVGLQRGLDLDHVDHRDAFGDADDQLDAGIGRFEDRVGRERGPARRSSSRRLRSLRPHRARCLNTGRPRCVLPPLPGDTPPTILVP